MSNTAAILERYSKVMFPAVTPYHGDNPLVVDHAKDQYIWDIEGRRYLDFFGGILTVSVGHCNDEITERTLAQLQKLQHTSTIYVNEVMVRLAEKVAELTPGRLQKCFFSNSGTEANETAVLAARMHTGNPVVITLRHAYSGRSMLAMSLSAQRPWRLGGVNDPYVRHARNPYTFRAPAGMTPEQVVDLCVQDLEEIIATGTEGRIAAFMAEPIQGAGGFIVPPEDYFRRVLPIVKEAGGLFIADEVQTGWGRTGDKWCGIEHWGVEPDIMTFAKGMANGVPIGGTITRPEIADSVKGLSLSTFGGNPVTCAAALATIEVVENQGLVSNAAERGHQLREGLLGLQQKYPLMGDVRGMGLMQAVEMVGPDKTPSPEAVARLFELTKQNGLLVGKGGLMGNVIRVTPALTVTKGQVDEALERLDRSLGQMGL